MMRLRSIALMAAASALAACAHPPDRRGPSGGPPRARMFISPAGQPFRPTPDATDPMGAWWAKADRDRDGVLDQAELKADAATFFKTLDTDADGQLSSPEITRYETVVAPEIVGDFGQVFEARGRGRRGGPPGGGFTTAALQGAAPFSLLNDPQPIMSADYDLSRRVSLAEFERKAATVFALLDANDDGRWARSELRTPPALRARRDGAGRGPDRSPEAAPPPKRLVLTTSG